LPWLANEMGAEPDKVGLSQNTMGYTSSSGATLQVDLDNDIVVAQARNGQGPLFEEHRYQFLKAIAEGFVD